MSESNPGYDEEVIDSIEGMVHQNPLVRLFGDHAKTRMLAALLNADPTPLNPTSIVENAGLSARSTWYDHKDQLLDSGLVIQDGNAGNSPLYRINDEAPHYEALRKVADYTSQSLYHNG